MALTNAFVLDTLKHEFPDAIVAAYEPYGMLTVTIEREMILPVIAFVRDNSALQMSFLTDICGIHFPDSPGKELGVIYHVQSMVNNFRLRIKSFFPIADPHVPTLTTMYSSANWMERETYDFFGIVFDGHPDMRRILNIEDMDYFPMRKEYPLEDAYRTDKEDQYFGREGNFEQKFEHGG